MAITQWYDVKISGKYRGSPRVIEAAVQAFSAMDAAMLTVNHEYGRVDPFDYDYYTRRNGRQGVVLADGDFLTDQATFEEMATEITDPVRIARLDGAPELPLGLDELNKVRDVAAETGREE